MAYVAVKGGQEAIKESNILLEYDRIKSGQFLSIEVIKGTMMDLVYQIMSESSLYDIDLTSLAIKQARGSMEEAVFLLRAHRSTLPRLYYTTITDTKNMDVERRITASFKDVPGGQFLGKAYDFTQRFLDFNLISENLEDIIYKKNNFEEKIIDKKDTQLENLPKVVDYLDKIGLYNAYPIDNNEPDDITKKTIEFPASRSQRLQSLTRGQTGAVTSFGYAEIRGFGMNSHPNIGELRVGNIPLSVCSGEETVEEDEYYIGSILVTEVEAFCSTNVKGKKDQNTLNFEIGYGLVFGHNETKAVAMSVLDYALEYGEKSASPSSDEEFVLLHIDSVESSGFISHLKLPHYVTFQSALDGMRKINEGVEEYE